MIKTVVWWQFNRKFKNQRTFRSRAAAMRYCMRVKQLWRIIPRMADAK